MSESQRKVGRPVVADSEIARNAISKVHPQPAPERAGLALQVDLEHNLLARGGEGRGRPRSHNGLSSQWH
jgi:hypothetical protein